MTGHVELAVIGAGPAGLAAAIAAAEAGVAVALIDGRSRPGGQYFSQPPPEFSPPLDDSRRQEASTVLAQLAASPVRTIFDTLVWGAFPEADGGWLLTLYGPGAPRQLRAGMLVLATGAYDRPIPFPGWTLPGVMTAGAAQLLLKSQRVLPGRRFLLSGTGPLQLAVAAQLVQAGAEVAAVLEGAAVSVGRGLKYLGVMRYQSARLREGLGYGATLRLAGVPLHRGWAVTAVRGKRAVQAAVITRLDAQWRPIRGTEEILAVDTVLLGYGFTPNTQLSRLLGCEHQFRPEQGGYVPRRTAEFETSCPGVFAVGDGAGIGGAALARLEGRVAGLAVARRLGRWRGSAAVHEQAALAKEQRFARMLGEMFTPGPGLYTLADDRTLICRCEEVPLAEIRTAVREGATTVTEVKGCTRAGMGNCQGRICGELVARAIASELGQTTPEQVEAAGMLSVRPPLVPLPLSVLAGAGE
jgi:NADPH-dependent 2,4-dienoyl-CoA reductase/sulfur reductase-like enzyme